MGQAAIGSGGTSQGRGLSPHSPIPTCLDVVNGAGPGTVTGPSLGTVPWHGGRRQLRLFTAHSHSLADFTEVRSMSEQAVSSASQAPLGLGEVEEEDCSAGPLSDAFSSLP